MRSSDNIRRTPQKLSASNSNKKRMIDEVLSKDLLISPFKDTFTNNLLLPYTPLRKQPQYLLSPSPVKKDLFSQLLGTETKQATPLNYDSSIMEEDLSFEEQSIIEESCHSSSGEDEQRDWDNECNWSNQNDQNEARKRKRKSTSQIKILKQGIDGELNWTKQKIVKMAEITGLSQSQVYKWCWDQKKKLNRNKLSTHSFGEKRKLIRKDLGYRNNLPYNRHKEDEDSYQQPINEKQGSQDVRSRQSLTKQKLPFKMDENGLEQTEKKLNKRLIFS